MGRQYGGQLPGCVPIGSGNFELARITTFVGFLESRPGKKVIVSIKLKVSRKEKQ
jgi:hypothetical protein